MADKTLNTQEDIQLSNASEDLEKKIKDYFGEMNEVIKKLSSDDPHMMAEGLLQTYLYSKTNSFTAPDEAEFGSCVNDVAERIEADNIFKDAMKEKYGDPVPSVITTAGVFGFVEATKDNQDMNEITKGMLGARKMTSDIPESFEELKASITDKALLADVEEAYARGLEGAGAIAKAVHYINETSAPKYVSSLDVFDEETAVRVTENPFVDSMEDETLDVIPRDYGSMLGVLSSESTTEEIKDVLQSILFTETGSDEVPDQERFDMLVNAIATDIKYTADLDARLKEEYGDDLPKEIIQAKLISGLVDYNDPEYAAYANDPEFNQFISSDHLIRSIEDSSLSADVSHVVATGSLHDIRTFYITGAIDEMVFEARYGLGPEPESAPIEDRVFRALEGMEPVEQKMSPEEQRVADMINSDDFAKQAEGFMRQQILRQTGTSQTIDEDRLSQCIYTAVKYQEVEDAYEDGLKAKYGENVPEQIEQAQVFGMKAAEKTGPTNDAIDYTQRMYDHIIADVPSYAVLLANTADPDLREDVKAGFAYGKESAEVANDIFRNLVEIIEEGKELKQDVENCPSLKDEFNDVSGDAGAHADPVQIMRDDMGIKDADHDTVAQDAPKPALANIGFAA